MSCVFRFKYFPKNHKVRFWSLTALIFTISEALIGALLVLKGLTGGNISGLRLVILNAHLLNSLFLTASLVLCFRFSLKDVQVPVKKMISLVAFYVLIAFTGSMASLSNTLFPSSSLRQGWMMDFAESSPWMVQFRLWHPVLAFLIGGAFVLYLFWSLKKDFFQFRKLFQSQGTVLFKIQKFLNTHRQFLLMCLLCLGILTGVVTLLTLSPLVMRMVHLFIAYLIWTLIFLL